jgi:DNA-binding LacI/PurR family transcriptional regulator
MKDVAERAGVSVSTVSYVLNNSGPVAEARRARVLDAVRILDYTPNESARGLKRRSSPTVGLVVPELSNQFFALLAEGVERAASERDALVVLCAPEAAGGTESPNARLVRSQRLSGVIYLSGGSTSPESLIELTRLGPVVLVDERIPGFDVPAVVSDSRRGAREVAQHVLNNGHKKLAVIGGPTNLWTAEQRLAGYREAVAAAGLDPDRMDVVVGDYHQPSGADLAHGLLSRPKSQRPTALLCANDLMAVGALEYCKAAGIRVPDEVSIVGFDDLPFVSLLTPSLTTVRQLANDMGYRAATILFDMLNGELEPPSEEMFPVEVQIRDSVAAPPTLR